MCFANLLGTSQDDGRPRWRFFVDSDHAGNAEPQNHRRSQNGGLATLNTAPTMWMSKATSKAYASEKIGEAHADISSASVETYAAGNFTFDVMAYSYVVEEMGLEFPKPFVLEIDNEAARIYMRGSSARSKLKHIDARQEWVLMLRNREIMEPVHIDSESNKADIFTKILPPSTFVQLRDSMMEEVTLP